MEPYLPNNLARILLIGCGNSNLGHDMWLDGFTNIECMDYAQSVITRMTQKYAAMYSGEKLKTM